MNLSIQANGIKLTPRLRTYIEKKTDRLDRYMPTLTKVKVDVSEQNVRAANQRQVAQITVRDRNGTILRAEERRSDIFASVDTVMDKIYRQISRYRGKRLSRRRDGNGMEELAMAEPVPVQVEAVNVPPSIVRRKQFSLQPMSLDEACEQMELLGHDFFVFFYRETNTINVLYRREDGNYGLLQPDVGE